MIKRLLFIFCLSGKILAGEAIVTVLEAPLLEKQDMNSRVLQIIKKGQTLYIHDRYFLPSGEKRKELFLETLDAVGNRAWIPRNFVKLVYLDSREYQETLASRSGDVDPTDYRIDEPPPKNFPFVKLESTRASVVFKGASQNRINYPYPVEIQSKKLSPDFGLEVAYTLRAKQKFIPDRPERIYWGMLWGYAVTRGKLTLADASQTRETESKMQFGPQVSYDAYRTQKYRLTLASSATLNLHRAIFAGRSFRWVSISPKFSSRLFFKGILPEVAFFTGVQLQFFLPHKLKSSSPGQNLSVSFREQLSLLGGFEFFW